MMENPTTIAPMSAAERGMRLLLLFTLMLGMFGIAADLLLLDHIESATQAIPVILLGVAFLALVMHLTLRSASGVRIVQVVMLLFLACGGLGAYFHFMGNAEFQRDIRPDLRGLDLAWKVLRAKSPPALAPMSLVQLGLVGLAWSYRHPLLRAARSRAD